MLKKFQFYKNIILVVASALTLVAVTFAWFSSSYENNLSTIQAEVGGDIVNVDFYQMDANGDYGELTGNIELNDFIPGSYNKYKMVVTTKTADPLSMNFGIVGLPEDMNADLKASVCISYKLYSAAKQTAADGTVTYVDGTLVSESNGYVPLSELDNGAIFNAISLENYQSSSADSFVIYYEIGLSENGSSAIEGLSSSLGDIKISAQRIG
ncbi:MAG: hypothetical protein IKT61_01320 [Clostridia bacterium]|nr:hypothetical protein [Clostridia bacterium]